MKGSALGVRNFNESGGYFLRAEDNFSRRFQGRGDGGLGVLREGGG